MYSNFINLNDFFEGCGPDYCVIKMPSYFPNYYAHSDLDILCKDKEQMTLAAVTFLRRKQYKAAISVHHPESGKHSHVDVYPIGKPLDFKFDFIDSFSMYKKNRVSNKFKDFILENKVIANGVYVPSMPCEMVIRKLEYEEHIESRPDKIKHLKYVESKPEYAREFQRIWETYVLGGR